MAGRKRDKLYFILAIHNHQPVGNFERVFEEAYHKAYLPFLKTLERHPKMKLVFHYSGSLLSWLKDNHYDFLASLKSLVRKGRVELLSGGFYEPILSAIPEEDRIGQIKKLTEFISNEFGYLPRGMWLAERIWEPDMPKHIAMSDIDYLTIDDYHFKLTGLNDKELRGYFITESDGYKIKVLPGNEKLRYLIPFKSVNDVISYLKVVYEESNSPMISMADDGEKFGIWPGTYKHVYTNGWLDRFFCALTENSDWLEITTYNDYLSKVSPLGRVYLPTASYREMGEWSLLSDAPDEYENVFETLKSLFGNEKAQSLMRGGFWKNFLAKYPEANHIHKRMFQISRKVHQAVKRQELKSKRREQSNKRSQNLLNELWQGQCNDAYWHGIFGGLYLPHLRSSLYNHLIKAERLSEDMLGLTSYITEGDDIDKDGYNDLFIGTETLSLFLSEKGGNLFELSYKNKAINILDTLTRRFEPYHKKMLKPANTPDVQTIHKNIRIKDKRIQKSLIFDTYRKASLIDHFLPEDITLDLFRHGRYQELWDCMERPYMLNTRKTKSTFFVELTGNGHVSNVPVVLKKKVSVYRGRPVIRVVYDFYPPENACFCTEFNLSFLGSPFPSILISSPDKKNVVSAINSTGEWENIHTFAIKDDYLCMSVFFNFDESINLWHFPVETVSLSEGGIEKVYQGTTFLLFPHDVRDRFSFVITLKDNE